MFAMIGKDLDNRVVNKNVKVDFSLDGLQFDAVNSGKVLVEICISGVRSIEEKLTGLRGIANDRFLRPHFLIL